MNTFLALLLIVAVIGLLVLLRRLGEQRSAHERNMREAEQRQSQLRSENNTAQTEIARLSKWTAVADADEKASALLRDAQAGVAKAESQAAEILAEARRNADAEVLRAKQEAESANAEANQAAKTLKSKVADALDSANLQAQAIISAAEGKAREIAGSAYDARQKAKLYEDTVQAMRNIIDGYGNQYVTPERSLLDDLAEEFGFAEAGEELRKAREQTKAMIRSGTAASCLYIEPSRRVTAITFVIDAFNGRVDSILSRVKHDNVGTLEQEIRDAFTLVNFSGKAFRDARIMDAFLDARLAELKWAAVAQQMKLDEREEQRRIKEKIREEEKARRDFERAIRDAAKEEDLLRKAMEKAQLQMAQASEEQKAKYEQQLQELTEKLKTAEERNQRALSMAQQTKRGHVYIISNIGSFGEHVYKIGLTRRLEPLDRVRELGDSSVPFEFDVHAMIFSEDAPALEAALHNHFALRQLNKVNHRKEFFRAELGHIRDEVEKFGLSPKWTLTAAAREYHESLAIEKAIAEDPAKKEAWLNRQLQLEKVQSGEPEPMEVADDE